MKHCARVCFVSLLPPQTGLYPLAGYNEIGCVCVLYQLFYKVAIVYQLPSSPGVIVQHTILRCCKMRASIVTSIPTLYANAHYFPPSLLFHALPCFLFLIIEFCLFCCNFQAREFQRWRQFCEVLFWKSIWRSARESPKLWPSRPPWALECHWARR